jgi:L-lysine exporter family protein LysE/ArgO
MLNAFIYGTILAFGLILPLGPQNIFILNQGGHGHGIKHALPAVITASLCDTVLILLASYGISLFILQHVIIEQTLLIVGILFLLYLGVHMWSSAEKTHKTKTTPQLSAKKQILFCASVSILNPHAILDTIAVIGSNAMLFEGSAHMAFTLSCIFVSWTWFMSLALFGKWIARFEKFKFYQDRFSAIIILLSTANLAYHLYVTLYPLGNKH